jgi:hypothetical protein
MKNLPEKIYLQIGEEADIDDNFDFNELVGVSWCSDKIEESDVEFVRSDISEQMAKEFAEQEIINILSMLSSPLTDLLSNSEYRDYVNEFINSRKALKEEK